MKNRFVIFFLLCKTISVFYPIQLAGNSSIILNGYGGRFNCLISDIDKIILVYINEQNVSY